MIEDELEKWVSEFHPTVEKEVLEVIDTFYKKYSLSPNF